MSPAPPEATKYTVEFHVDDEVGDPYEMYYADKRQKIDLPTMLANEKGCEAQLSPDGRVRLEICDVLQHFARNLLPFKFSVVINSHQPACIYLSI